MKLQLEAKTQTEELIKTYLEQNASETLANKINNGVPVTKDNVTLLNKKTLSGFIRYASEEAKKLSEKGTASACIKDTVVYGWAIHYFEENSIEGTLYNEDGSEYKPPKPVQKVISFPTSTVPVKPEPPKKSQPSLFELMSKEQQQEPEPTEEEIREAMQIASQEETKQEVLPEPKKPALSTLPGSPLYQKYKKIQNQYPDAIVAYRLGDFYEILGQNAVTIANELDLTLTSRDCGLESRVPMVGFPYHATEIFFDKINAKHALVISEHDKLQYKPVVDIDEIVDDDLTEAEMRFFDGDIEEEKHWIDDTTYVDNDGTVHTKEDDELEKDLAFTKAFDKDALGILDGIFGNLITLE